jgi:hypothetical protein
VEGGFVGAGLGVLGVVVMPGGAALGGGDVLGVRLELWDRVWRVSRHLAADLAPRLSLLECFLLPAVHLACLAGCFARFGAE